VAAGTGGRDSRPGPAVGRATVKGQSRGPAVFGALPQTVERMAGARPARNPPRRRPPPLVGQAVGPDFFSFFSFAPGYHAARGGTAGCKTVEGQARGEARAPVCWGKQTQAPTRSPAGQGGRRGRSFRLRGAVGPWGGWGAAENRGHRHFLTWGLASAPGVFLPHRFFCGSARSAGGLFCFFAPAVGEIARESSGEKAAGGPREKFRQLSERGGGGGGGGGRRGRKGGNLSSFFFFFWLGLHRGDRGGRSAWQTCAIPPHSAAFCFSAFGKKKNRISGDRLFFAASSPRIFANRGGQLFRSILGFGNPFFHPRPRVLIVLSWRCFFPNFRDRPDLQIPAPAPSLRSGLRRGKKKSVVKPRASTGRPGPNTAGLFSADQAVAGGRVDRPFFLQPAFQGFPPRGVFFSRRRDPAPRPPGWFFSQFVPRSQGPPGASGLNRDARVPGGESSKTHPAEVCFGQFFFFSIVCLSFNRGAGCF